MKLQIYLLIIFGIIIFTRTIHKLNIYRNNLSDELIELEILWREDSESCYQSQSSILIYLPDCFKYPAGTYLKVSGSLQTISDTQKNPLKVLMVQSIQSVEYSRVSVKYILSIWWQNMAKLRRNIKDQMRWILGYSGGSLLFSLVLGGVKSLPVSVQKGIENLGLMYIFSASGMHVGLLLEMIGKRIKKCSRKLQLVIQFLVLFIYSSLTLWKPAIVRSGLMASYRLMAKQIWLRPASPLLSLIWTVILMLGLNPLWCLESGFWMSVMATLAILLVSPLVNQKNCYFVWEMGNSQVNQFSDRTFNLDSTRRNWSEKIISYTRQTIVFSLTAQIAILPLVIQTFDSWSWVGVISSWFVLWILPTAFRLGAILITGLMVINLPELMSGQMMLTRGTWLNILKLLTLPIRGWLNEISHILEKSSNFTWTLFKLKPWSVANIWTWYIGWCFSIYIWKKVNIKTSYLDTKNS